jgi:hypothetical protein
LAIKVVVPCAAAERLTSRAIRETKNPEALLLEGLGADHRLSRLAPRCHMLGIAQYPGEALPESL